jgi:outer membrane lipoprotein carrier protein
MFPRLILIAALFGFAQVSLANGVDQLKAFLDKTRVMRANFTQTVTNRDGKVTQESSGSMELMRPGKFRWVYEKPYEQLIVGDGTRLWLFDRELNQVTVKKLDQAIGSTPAAFLAGSNEVDKFFALQDVSAHDQLEWVEATPKSKESTFESMRVGFHDGALQEMVMHDHFGQTTVIHFSKVERNVKVSPDNFKFVPPKGADVVGDL